MYDDVLLLLLIVWREKSVNLAHFYTGSVSETYVV